MTRRSWRRPSTISNASTRPFVCCRSTPSKRALPSSRTLSSRRPVPAALRGPSGPAALHGVPGRPPEARRQGSRTLYPAGTERRRTIDPIGDWSFIGRGPLQVTHRLNYIEVLAYLEKAADAASSDDAATIRKRSRRSKPTRGRRRILPTRCLFSAAFMKTEGGDVLASRPGVKTFGGKGVRELLDDGRPRRPPGGKEARGIWSGAEGPRRKLASRP